MNERTNEYLKIGAENRIEAEVLTDAERSGRGNEMNGPWNCSATHFG